jgi:transposase
MQGRLIDPSVSTPEGEHTLNQPTLQMKDTTSDRKLFLAIELSEKSWTLVFGDGSRMRLVAVPVGDVDRIAAESVKARMKFGLPEQCSVLSCYEAGRDGFWVHRALLAKNVTNIVVDSTSIEVDRRQRRAKTDRLDAEKLLARLIRHHRGEPMRVVNVPSREVEDARRDGREMERLKKERTAHLCRIKALLALHGTHECKRSELESAKDWEGKQLPPAAVDELVRERTRLELVETQLKAIVQRRDQRLEEKEPSPMAKLVTQLMHLRGIGETSAWLFVQEFFGWRTFKNRRQVGAAAGLTCSPFDSGNDEKAQGISKTGNRRVRVMAIQIAWCWLRFQRESALSKWFHARFGIGKRTRRIGIVALARRLIIACWQYLDRGLVPEGATLKTA